MVGESDCLTCGSILTESCTAGTVGTRVTNDLIDRAHPYGASQICFVDRSLELQQAGKIVSWDVYAGRAGEQRLQVWRPASDADDMTFTLVCENFVTSPNADEVQHFVLPETDHCLFKKGDRIGWYHLGQGVTDYDDQDLAGNRQGHDVIWNYPMDHPGLGGTVTFTGGGPRVYSVGATVLYGDFPTPYGGDCGTTGNACASGGWCSAAAERENGDDRCQEGCVSWSDPRQNYHCLWNAGTIPDGEMCGVNPAADSYDATAAFNNGQNPACASNCCQMGLCAPVGSC